MTGQISNSRGIPIGLQLGNLEYLVTPESLGLYRDAVGYPVAEFPNSAARECLEVLAQKIFVGQVDSVTHSDQYYRAPVAGRRVQVTGWVRDHYLQRGAERLVVETFAVDDIGTEILRSQHTFQFGTARAAGRLGRRPSRKRRLIDVETIPDLEKRVTDEVIEKFENANRTLLGRTAGGSGTQPANLQANAGLASGMGLATAVAPEELGTAYLHELLDRRFGIDFRQGGSLSVNFRRPIYAGDTLVAQGLATMKESQGNRAAWQAQIWLENGRGEQVITGEAQVTVPSPLT